MRIPVDGAEKDYMKICYAGTDSLYVCLLYTSLQHLDLTCVVFLSYLFAYVGHIASPYLLDSAAVEREELSLIHI